MSSSQESVVLCRDQLHDPVGPLRGSQHLIPRVDPKIFHAPTWEEISEREGGMTTLDHPGCKVRALGIDSCAMQAPETYGGELAKQLTGSNTVTMTTEPGVDKDRNGWQVRYVQVEQPSGDGIDRRGWSKCGARHCAKRA